MGKRGVPSTSGMYSTSRPLWPGTLIFVAGAAFTDRSRNSRRPPLGQSGRRV
jgi:hypothetical protein